MRSKRYVKDIEPSDRIRIESQLPGFGGHWAGLRINSLDYNVSPVVVKQNSAGPNLTIGVSYQQGIGSGPNSPSSSAPVVSRECSAIVSINNTVYTSLLVRVSQFSGYATVSTSLPTNIGLGTHNVHVSLYDPSGLSLGFGDDAQWVGTNVVQYSIYQDIFITHSGGCITWAAVPGATYYTVTDQGYSYEASMALWYSSNTLYSNQYCDIVNSFSSPHGGIEQTIEVNAYNSQGQKIGVGVFSRSM
jgi:hypothetical protein